MTDRVKLALIGMSVLMVGLVVFAMSRQADQTELRRLQEEARDGTLCVLLQLSAHRENAYAHDRAEAAAQGFDVDLPEPAPGAPTIDPAVCGRYITDGGQ